MILLAFTACRSRAPTVASGTALRRPATSGAGDRTRYCGRSVMALPIGSAGNEVASKTTDEHAAMHKRRIVPASIQRRIASDTGACSQVFGPPHYAGNRRSDP